METTTNAALTNFSNYTSGTAGTAVGILLSSQEQRLTTLV